MRRLAKKTKKKKKKKETKTKNAQRVKISWKNTKAVKWISG